MPKYKVMVIEDPEGSEGPIEEWNLPWECLVFDQRIDYQRPGSDAPARFKVRRIRGSGDSRVIDLVVDPGCLPGGDPKKDRP